MRNKTEDPRRESWQVVDDDTPRPPEANPLDSAQARRAWRLDQRLQNT